MRFMQFEETYYNVCAVDFELMILENLQKQKGNVFHAIWGK